MDSRLNIWFFFEIIREYPRVVHIFVNFEDGTYRAEFYLSRGNSYTEANLEYETRMVGVNAAELFYKIIKYVETLGVYEMEIKHDASDLYNKE